MRITIISLMEGFPWGGSEELWYQVSKRALAAGHEVQVCVKYWEDAPAKIAELQNVGAQIAFRNKPEQSTSWNLFKKKTPVDPQHYLEAVKNFKPEFVLVSQGGTFDILRRNELVSFLVSGNRKFSLISQFNFERPPAIGEEMKSNLLQLMPLWEHFYFVSDRNRMVAEKQSGVALRGVKIVDNPVNLKSKDLLPWPESPVLQLACVARYQFAMKGQDLLIEALNQLTEIKRPFQLNFFGSGPDKEQLLSLSGKCKYTLQIRVHEQVSDIDSIWSQHHVMLLPSLAEGTPLSVQEAMYKGRPVLATDVGDCAKLVIEGETGFLCRASTADDLRTALENLFSASDEQLREMGIRANRHVRAVINPDSASAILADISS